MSDKVSRSIQAGVVLILVGAAILYVNLQQDLSLAVVIAKYFPLIFVYLGIKRAVAYFRPQPPAPPGGKQPRSPSLAPALFLLGLGVVLLLGTTGSFPHFWRLFGMWWPLLLILMGLGKVADGMMPGRVVRFSAGEIVLIVFVIMFGLGARQTLNLNIPRLPFFMQKIFYNSFQFTKEDSIPAQGAKKVVLRHADGDVVVKPSVGDAIGVRVEETVYADDETSARAASQSRKFEGKTEGDALVIALKESGTASQNAKMDVTILLPKDVELSVDNINGDITLEDLPNRATVGTDHGNVLVSRHRGSLSISSRYGDVEVKNAGGSVSLSANHSDSKLTSIAGDLTVEGNGGVLTVEDVQGAVKFSGERTTLHVSRVKGAVEIKDRSDEVRLEDCESSVNLTLDRCELEVNRVGGPLTVNNTKRSSRLRNLQGSLTFTGNWGDLEVYGLPENPAARVQVTQGQGDVTLYLSAPPKQKFFGSSGSGSVTWELDAAGITQAQDGSSKTVRNFAGGPEAAEVNILCKQGDLAVRKIQIER